MRKLFEKVKWPVIVFIAFIAIGVIGTLLSYFLLDLTQTEIRLDTLLLTMVISQCCIAIFGALLIIIAKVIVGIIVKFTCKD